ncbi:MAG TPA: DUF4241 domain-containing protein [Myxococcaceae bacterium]|nr:DUF4241 domain-containing protein [Myxococcaceae bacterium]
MSNLLSAFQDGARLTDSGQPVGVTVRSAGSVEVRSGRLLLTHPRLKVARPYVRSIPPGRYPVLLSVRRDPFSALDKERVGLVMVRIRDGEPASWELALRKGQDSRLIRPVSAYRLKRDERAHSLLALLDSEGARKVKKAWTALEGTLAQMDPRRVGCLDLPFRDSELNAVAWSNGGPAVLSWWGLDAAGEPVCLVLDCGAFDLRRPTPGGDVGARREWIRALIAELRDDGASVERKVVSRLADYGGEAEEALDLMLELVAAEGERDVLGSRLWTAADAVARICEERPVHVPRVAEALAEARSEGAAAGLLAILQCFRGELAKPLVPAVMRYLEPGHSRDVYLQAWESMGALAWVAPETMPAVLQAVGRMEGFCKGIALCAVENLLKAGAKAELHEVLGVLDPMAVDDAPDDSDSFLPAAQMDVLICLGVEKDEVLTRMLMLLASNSNLHNSHVSRYLSEAKVPPARMVDVCLRVLGDERSEASHEMVLHHLAEYFSADPRVEPTLLSYATSGTGDLRECAREALAKHLVGPPYAG